ncbi:MAG: glycosyltransferase [Xanthobacteraceae bacterium]
MSTSNDITFVLTSCNRFDLLRETVESFLTFNTCPIAEYLFVEDSGNDQIYELVRSFGPAIKVILNDPPIGQIASIDKAYAELHTPYIFHCEDDWRFFRKGFIEESLVLLDSVPEVSVVSGRRRGQKPDFDRRFFNSPQRHCNGIGYRFNAPEPEQIWGGYTFNPGLRRLQDYRKLGSFGAVSTEADISRWFLKHGMHVAHLEHPACETTGHGRHLVDPSAAKRQGRRIELTIRDRIPVLRKRLSSADGIFLAELPLLWFAARFLPEAKWCMVSAAMQRVKIPFGRTKIKRRAAKIAAALGLPAADTRAFAIARAASARRTEHRVQLLRELSRASWKANIVLEGENELRSALDEGKGAVLWIAHTAFNTQATKMALHRAGCAVSHISRPEHGFSKSRFGIRFLNPKRWQAEAKYLKERIIVDRSQPGSALARAAAVLDSNGIVSITAGAWEGRHIARTELFGRRLELATGAPSLAQATGARLLPVFTVRDGDDGRITVRIGPSIKAVNCSNRDWAIQQAVREFVDDLEQVVREHPDQWRGWDD